MRLTILVPLLGAFLMFNQATEQFVRWPDFLVRDLGTSPDTLVATNNLYWTYFGLLFLGFGSIIFSLLCPTDIRAQADIGKYVLEAPSVTSPVIAKDDFRTVLALRFAHELRGEESGEEHVDYPDDLAGDFHALMSELYEAVDHDEIDDTFPDVMMASGYLDFTELARMIWDNPKVVWAYTLPYYDAATRFARDIAFVKHKSLDYTGFWIRLSVAVAYLVGFCLLLKPTLHVSILLAIAWFTP